MRQADTFNTTLGAHKTADGYAGRITRLGVAIREVWAWLLEVAGEAEQETDESWVADSDPGILANYYDGARDRVAAGEPMVSFRELARRKVRDGHQWRENSNG